MDYYEPPNDGIYLTPSHQVIVGDRSPYEFKKFAIAQLADKVIFSILSSLPLQGRIEPRAIAGRIGYGDLILDYGDRVIGIRLTGKTGVYKNITLVNDAGRHHGFKTFAGYTNKLSFARGYDSPQPPPNWVTGFDNGQRIDSVSVTQAKLKEGYWIAIAVPRSALPEGTFTAALAMQCLNDWVIGQYTLDPVTGYGMAGLIPPASAAIADPLITGAKQIPESDGVAGMAIAVLTGFLLTSRKSSSD